LILGTALACALAAIAATPALGAFPYSHAGADTKDYTDLWLNTEVPNDLSGDGNDFKFAATADPSNDLINSNPVELGGIRGAHLDDASIGVDYGMKLTTGRPDVTISVLDSGIKWNDQGAMSDLRLKFRLSRGELPVPQADLTSALIDGLDCSTFTGNPNDAYDLNDDGVFNLADYACDSRIDLSDSRRDGPGGFMTPQDVLIAFSNGTDSDNNGYTDDIVGWDFLDDDNDAFDDVQYGHGTGEANDSSAEANNGDQMGSCPNCTVIPLRVGDSFVADVNRFAAAVTYAVDNRVLVIQEALGTLNNSSLARDAVEYAYRHGVTIIASAADEAAQHNNWPSSLPHVIVVNSVTRSDIADNQPNPISYLAFNGCTNFSAKITLAIPSTSCSSNATGLAAGMAGLVYSAALNAIKKGALTRHTDSGDLGCQLTFDLGGTDNPVPGTPDACPVTPNEVRQLMASGLIDRSGTLTRQSDDVNFAGTPPGSGNEPSCSPAPASGCTDPNGALKTQVDANRPALVPASTSYPARLGHDQFYGYGRVNMFKALNALINAPVNPSASNVPPEAELTSPAWFEAVNPSRTSIDVTGQVFARGGTYSCRVYVAPGHYPNNRLATAAPPGDFHAVPAGGGACDGNDRADAVDGLLAQIDTATLKSYFPPETQATGFTGREPGAGAQTSNGRPNTDPYGFVVKVEVTKVAGGGAPVMRGEDQRAAFLHHDQDLMDGYPKAITGGGQLKDQPEVPTGDGESSPAFADLDGDNRSEMIFASSDGFVHALKPDGGELANWPVRGDRPGFIHLGSEAYSSGEVGTDVGGAFLASVAVGDTDRNGIPEVYAADMEGKVYGWNPNGTRVFEQESNPQFSGQPLQPFVESRHGEFNRTQHGFIGSPVLADIDGDGRAEIVAASMDRHLYAWNRNGAPVDSNGDDDPDFPLLVMDPAKIASIDPQTEQVSLVEGSDAQQQGAIIDTPAVADLIGDPDDPRPQIVLGTNEEYEGTMNAGSFNSSGLSFLGASGLLGPGNGRLFLIKPDGDTDNDPDPTNAIYDGWPFALGIANVGLLPVVGEGVTGPPVIGPADCPSGGSGLKIGAMANNGPAYILNPDATSCYGESPGGDGMNRPNVLASDFSASTQRYDTPVLPAVGNPAFGDMPGGVSFLAPAAGTLRALDVIAPEYQGGQDFVGAWNASTGEFQPNFPATVNDLQFITGPSAADIDGNPGEEILEGTSSKDFAAFSPGGTPASPNWPKVTTDWTVANPLIGSFGTIDTDPGARKVAVNFTRSGYISVYETTAPACSPSSWPRFHHDNANSGNYERDATLPGKPTGPGVPTQTTISFTAPGDDLLCGTPDHYEVVTSDSPIDDSSFNSATELCGSGDPGCAATAASGGAETFDIPAGALRYLAIRAVDDQGNVGRSAPFDRGANASPGGGQGTGTGAGQGAGPTAQAPQLSLKLKPRRARTGRRTCFTATVTSAAQPVAAASVAIGPKQRQTGTDGVARICRRFKHPRQAAVSAQKEGFTGTSRSIRVRS
jgi:hypothetical protein